jgi:hypothetical protein
MSSAPGADGRVRPDTSSRGLLIGLLLLVSCFYGSLIKDSYLNDFRAYYVAAVATHDHLDPYVNHVNESERYMDGSWLKADSRFVYPPTALPFFAPFARLSYNHAKGVFAVLILLTMIGILDFFHRLYPGLTLVLLVLFISLPMFAVIDNGQVDVFILALILGAFYLADGWKAGLCLGAAIAIKLAPVLLVLWFLGNRRWRTVAWSVVAGGLLAGVSLAGLGTTLFREYFAHLVNATKGNHGASIKHHFEGLRVMGGRLIETVDGLYEFQHRIYGFRQNPLFPLGRIAVVIGVALPVIYMAWLLLTKRGRMLQPQQSYFMYIVVCLFANLSLWPMGLVACFPLLVLLVATAKTPNRTALLLLAPMLLTQQLVGQLNFLLWVVVAVVCIAQSGWLVLKADEA